MGNNIVEHTLNKVVFLDRDGTLNEEVNYLHKPEDMKLLPGVPQALKKLKDAGYKLDRSHQPGGSGKRVLYRRRCKNPSPVYEPAVRKRGSRN